MIQDIVTVLKFARKNIIHNYIYLINKENNIIGEIYMCSIIINIKKIVSLFNKEKIVNISNNKYEIDNLGKSYKSIKYKILFSLNNKVVKKFV